MPNPTTPLLADDRRRSIDSDDSEDDILRGRSQATHTGRSLYLRIREVLLFIWALLATAGVLILAVWVSHKQQTSFDKPDGKRNLIFMVSDGMGPASLSLTRSFRQYTEHLEYGDTLTLDKHFWGSSRTRSSSSLITDSAAGATAFSCAKKSYNGAISTLPDSSPCGTVLEAAKRAGFMTGLVVTTDITDATPACFSSHVDMRTQNDEIALQQVGQGPLDRVVDLMFGGGRCRFFPNSTSGGCRNDDINVVDIAKNDYGWNYIEDRASFDEFWLGKKDVPLPMLGLFADTDIPFELDRRQMNEVYPSLSEMTKTALRALEKATENSDKGFFLMVEGSRIDHAGHGNDPAAQVREVLEYDKAMKAVLDFLKESKVDGVMVATSDHETGGLSVAKRKQHLCPLNSEPILTRPPELNVEYPEYIWYPGVLANASWSSEYLAHRLQKHVARHQHSDNGNVDELKRWINEELVGPGLGISDATEEELTTLAFYPALAQPAFAKMISDRAGVGWSTHGHSAVDVNIYSSGGPGTDSIRGNVENTDVGRFLHEYLDVDIEAVTRELKDKRDAENRRLRSAGQGVKEEEVAAETETVAPPQDHWATHEALEAHRLQEGVQSSP
ncbi:hypothetical protein DL765_007333 [Monosporascus sp. GIB2]|nr:hypothetical protein DL765_007333 [Monosporascus sp. GIB2]